MKLRYYGVDKATGKLWYFGVGDKIYTGIYDDDTAEWQLDLWNAALPAVYYANTYRIDDSNNDQILYSSDGKRYIADLDLKKLGASSSYVWSINNIKETNLTSLPFTESDDSTSEDDLAKATSSPLIPILLIGAAYFIFFR